MQRDHSPHGGPAAPEQREHDRDRAERQQDQAVGSAAPSLTATVMPTAAAKARIETIHGKVRA